MFQSILFIAVIALGSINAQLAFRTDANTNSFQYQTPSSQTTFTRFFGGQAGTLLEGAEARTQAQVLPAPQNFAGYNYAPAAAPNGQEDFGQLQQQYAAQQQSAALQQPQQQQQQFTAQDIAAYFAQQQQAQQVQQQQQYAAPQFAQQQQYAAPQQQYAAAQQQYAAPQQQYAAPQQFSQLELQQAGSQQVAQTAQAPQTLGIQFSPSNEVSNVKFSSGSLNYNF